MKLITIDQARDHVKGDGDDDDLITIYGNGAEAACARLANRHIYATQDELTAARQASSAGLAAAYADYDVATAQAATATSAMHRIVLAEDAKLSLKRILDEHAFVMNGIVVTDDIKAAILLTLGNWYENRSEVVTGQGAAAVQLPMAASAIMSQYRWLGPVVL